MYEHSDNSYKTTTIQKEIDNLSETSDNFSVSDSNFYHSDSNLPDTRSQPSDICQLDGNNSLSDDSLSITEDSRKGNFRIIEANVNSLKGKKQQLKALIETERPDCLILVETKLDNSYQSSEFFDLNTWNVVVRQDRNINGGGVIIAVSRKFVVSPVNIEYDDNSNPELFWIKLHPIKRQKPIYICGFYRSQRDSRSQNT